MKFFKCKKKIIDKILQRIRTCCIHTIIQEHLARKKEEISTKEIFLSPLLSLLTMLLGFCFGIFRIIFFRMKSKYDLIRACMKICFVAKRSLTC